MSRNYATYNPALYARMTQAVSKSHPDKLSDFIKLVSDYNGSEAVLSGLLEKGGSDDPFIAFSNLKIAISKFQPSFDEHGNKIKLGHSDAGRVLLNNEFLLRNDKENGLYLTLGYDSLKTLINNFSSDPESDIGFIKSYKSQIIENNQKIDEEISQNFIIESKLRNSAYSQSGDSQLSSLEEKIQSLQALLTMDVKSSEANYKLMGSLKPKTVVHYLQGLDNLPAHLLRPLEIVNITDAVVDEDQRKMAWFQIYSFVANNKPINTQVLLSDYLKDLTYFNKLDENHEIIQKYGRPKMFGIEPIIEQKAITLMQAANVIDKYPFVSARIDSNSDMLTDYASELELLVTDFEKYYCDSDGNWSRKDLLTIPRDVNKTVLSLIAPKEEIQNLTKYLFFLQKSQKELIRSTPIEDFSEMILGLALTSRKYYFAKNKFGLDKSKLSKSDKESLKELSTNQVLEEQLPVHLKMDKDSAFHRIENSRLYRYGDTLSKQLKNGFFDLESISYLIKTLPGLRETKEFYDAIELVKDEFSHDFQMGDLLGYSMPDFLTESEQQTIEDLVNLKETKSNFLEDGTKHFIFSKKFNYGIYSNGFDYTLTQARSFRDMMIKEKSKRAGTGFSEHKLLEIAKGIDYVSIDFQDKILLSKIHFMLSAMNQKPGVLKDVKKTNKDFLNFLRNEYIQLVHPDHFTTQRQFQWFDESSNKSEYTVALKSNQKIFMDHFKPSNGKHRWINRESEGIEYDSRYDQYLFRESFSKLELAKLLKTIHGINERKNEKLKIFLKGVRKN